MKVSSQYPRPDFQRSALEWASLNGPWDFIFDDGDVGNDQKWYKTGLPDEITWTRKTRSDDDDNAKSITQKIAAQPEKLSDTNAWTHNQDAVTHAKVKIEVPFVFQTPASGIDKLEAHEVLWYERNFDDLRSSADQADRKRLIIRFGAVDYETTVWLNGYYIGFHRGGHVPFSFDLTNSLVDGRQNRLTLRVRDSPYDLTQPRGKQYWAAKPESIFYTPSSGIWQSVWLEVLPRTRLADSSGGTVLRCNDLDKGVLHACVAIEGRRSGQHLEVQLTARYGPLSIAENRSARLRTGSRLVDVDLDLRCAFEDLSRATCMTDGQDVRFRKYEDGRGLALWSPNYPQLYDITVRLYEDEELIDEVSTYVGMRSLKWRDTHGTFELNNKPIFQALILDQGYWPRTGMTPPSQRALREDIELSKQMGFNGCRKHQKVEDPVFLYWADHLGYLVWGEAANGFEYSDDYVDRFNQEWVASVKRDINHPCIVAWTPINETWGYPDLANNIQQQNHIKTLCYMTKTLDPTRPLNDNCGWEHVFDDLTTFHDYADGTALTDTCKTLQKILGQKAGRVMFVGDARHREGAPILCTEFGGVNIAPKNENEKGERDWGYTTASDPNDLLGRIKTMMMGVVTGGHSCGFVYTQLTDIEQEVNGLYTFDRRPKLEAVKLKYIIEEVQRQYLQTLKSG